MSMRGHATNIVSDASRALVIAALGDNLAIVVDDLKGDASKGEPVVSGPFALVDEPHPDFPGVINNRVIKLGDNVVFGPVLTAAADRLTHAKAEATLRSFASAGGWPVRAPRVAKPAVDAVKSEEDESEYARDLRQLDEAVARFPTVFRMVGWRGELFRVSRAASYTGVAGPMLYTEVLGDDGWTAYAKVTEEELYPQVIQPSETDTDRVVDFYLEEMDRWRSGDKASPADGERYAGRMQDAIKRLAGQMRALGCKVDDNGNVLDEAK